MWWQMEVNQGTETKWHRAEGRDALTRAMPSFCATNNERGGNKTSPLAKQLDSLLQKLSPV